MIIENAREKSNSGGRVRDKKMSFWVIEAEQKKIKKLVAKMDLSQREYLLSAALGRTIYQVEELKPTLFELKAIVRNINQLTMLAHQGHVTTVNLTEATGALQRNYAAINDLYHAAGKGKEKICVGAKNVIALGVPRWCAHFQYWYIFLSKGGKYI